MSEERRLEDELLELIGHRFRRGLVNIADLAALDLTAPTIKMTEVLADMRRIKAEALQTLGITDALLSVASSNTVSTPCTPFDLATALRRITPELQWKAATGNFALVVDDLAVSVDIFSAATDVEKTLDLMLEIALRFGEPNTLRLQQKLDERMVIVLLGFTTPVPISRSSMVETLPLTNLLSLWACLRAAITCGGRLGYASVAPNDWELSIVLPRVNSSVINLSDEG